MKEHLELKLGEDPLTSLDPCIASVRNQLKKHYKVLEGWVELL